MGYMPKGQCWVFLMGDPDDVSTSNCCFLCHVTEFSKISVVMRLGAGCEKMCQGGNIDHFELTFLKEWPVKEGQSGPP